jgi:hypothetical protein
MNCCYRAVYWIYVLGFYCSRFFVNPADRQKEIKYNSVHPSKAPWLWIGAEMKDGKIVTVTDMLNKYIEYDDVVDIPYLEVATGLKEGVSRWLYLDSKTLNEQEFPPQGLVIKDDTNESATS